jgi:hypothetical protein
LAEKCECLLPTEVTGTWSVVDAIRNDVAKVFVVGDHNTAVLTW